MASSRGIAKPFPPSEMFRKELDRGEAGDNMGVLIRGTKREQVKRGQVIAAPGSIKSHKKFVAQIYVRSLTIVGQTKGSNEDTSITNRP